MRVQGVHGVGDQDQRHALADSGRQGPHALVDAEPHGGEFRGGGHRVGSATEGLGEGGEPLRPGQRADGFAGERPRQEARAVTVSATRAAAAVAAATQAGTPTPCR